MVQEWGKCETAKLGCQAFSGIGAGADCLSARSRSSKTLAAPIFCLVRSHLLDCHRGYTGNHRKLAFNHRHSLRVLNYTALRRRIETLWNTSWTSSSIHSDHPQRRHLIPLPCRFLGAGIDVYATLCGFVVSSVGSKPCGDRRLLDQSKWFSF